MSHEVKRSSPSPLPDGELDKFHDIRLESPPPAPPLSPSTVSNSPKSSRSSSPSSSCSSSNRNSKPIESQTKAEKDNILNQSDYVTLETINNSRASSRLSPAFQQSSGNQTPQPPELPPKSYQNVLSTNHVLPVPKRGVKPYKSTPTPTVVTPLPPQNDYYSEPKQQIYEHAKKLYDDNHCQKQKQQQSDSGRNLYQNSVNLNQLQRQNYIQQHQQQQQQAKQKKDRRFATALCVFVSVLTFVLVLMFYMVGESAFKSILMIFTFVTVLSVFLACFYRRPTIVYAPHCSPEALETIVTGSARTSRYSSEPKNPVLFILPPPVGANNAKLMLSSPPSDSLQMCPVHNQPVYMNDPNNNPHFRSIGPTPPPVQTIPGSNSDWIRTDRRRNTLNL